MKQGNVTTSYTYAGTNQDELLSESTPGGSTYDYAYGRADSNGLPEIESVTDNGSTGYVLHDPTGKPVMLQTAAASPASTSMTASATPSAYPPPRPPPVSPCSTTRTGPRPAPTSAATTAAGPKTPTSSKEAPRTASRAR